VVSARPVYKPRPPRATTLDPFKNYVIELLTAAPERIPAGVLLRELRERGYTDGYTMLKALVASLGPKEAAAAMAAKRPALTFPPRDAPSGLRSGRKDGSADRTKGYGFSLKSSTQHLINFAELDGRIFGAIRASLSTGMPMMGYV
jgi:hypothetical protein